MTNIKEDLLHQNRLNLDISYLFQGICSWRVEIFFLPIGGNKKSVFHIAEITHEDLIRETNKFLIRFDKNN